ncbi:DUF721 domain-containing protein [Pelagicoccus sp. NFK12]|uniref:DUF721 domain-containing protein n=1 Tax=Pelagicoccus enzymogenes TaxID=2773457 RepID=A0A927IFZ7_9BACT|nr:DUF721 domain-containing protein [Pelagicoccus enzymogenes]MBD5778304.1 DUF721 domain-containing protein [Pelagicoccus enzymogenes]MDQ8199652.1 DUF721 domain-containing protein [Pelagicoccus enzymogenes]
MSDQPYKFRKSVERLIANFRGIPENYPGEAPKTERPMADVLERVLKKYKIGQDSLEDRIVKNWAQIVGAANARNCAPNRIEKERTLIIAVSNPVIRQELEFNKRLILQNLHKVEGAKKIRNIFFKSG